MKKSQNRIKFMSFWLYVLDQQTNICEVGLWLEFSLGFSLGLWLWFWPKVDRVLWLMVDVLVRPWRGQPKVLKSSRNFHNKKLEQKQHLTRSKWDKLTFQLTKQNTQSQQLSLLVHHQLQWDRCWKVTTTAATTTTANLKTPARLRVTVSTLAPEPAWYQRFYLPPLARVTQGDLGSNCGIHSTHWESSNVRVSEMARYSIWMLHQCWCLGVLHPIEFCQ